MTTSGSPLMPKVSGIRWSTDFIVVEAEHIAAAVLAVVRVATAQWVVVRRNKGYYQYVFGVRELLDHANLERLREQGHALDSISLEAALDLHEEQSSTKVPDSSQLAPIDLSWRPNERAPTAFRYVETDATEQPVAVGGKDIQRRRTTRGRRPYPYVPTRSHPPEVAPPAAVAADDEGSTPIRHPSIEPEGALAAGAPVTLVIDLLREASAHTAGGPLGIGALDGAWQSLELEVMLMCPSIQFDAGGRGCVTIRRNDTSVAARIAGRLDAGLTPGSEIDVTAQFFCGTRYSGRAQRRLKVGDAAAPIATDTSTIEAAATPTRGAVMADPQAEQPDLTVYILLVDPATPGKLRWQMATKRFAALPPAMTGITDLGRDPAAEAAALYLQFAKLTRGQHRARIEGFGDELWQRAPQAFRDVYWAMCDHHGRMLTIQFISEEPHLPWELMRPTRADDSETHPPLALKHSVARWIARWDGYMRNRLPSGRLATIAPKYSNVSMQLSSAEAESAQLEADFHALRVKGDYASVRALLETAAPAEPIALLHFAGHGTFAADAVDGSTIKLEDGALAVAEVARREVRLGVACHTLVLFNACEVGASGSALGAVGGWADAFLGRQFGGFIAPLWAVDDDDASLVVKALIDGIVTRSEPVGAVLRAIREQHGDVSPTFFSYLYYGDVTARLTAGGE